jgi:hypothetical protein
MEGVAPYRGRAGAAVVAVLYCEERMDMVLYAAVRLITVDWAMDWI